MAEEQKNEIRWQVEEFAYREKDPQWFMLAGIAALTIVIILVLLKNIFGVAVILLFAVILYMYATKKPDTLHVVVNPRGIMVNDKLTPFSSLTSFWILFEPPLKDLILIHKARFMPKMIVPLGNAHPVALREILLANTLPEKEEEESLIDILARRFGF